MESRSCRKVQLEEFDPILEEPELEPEIPHGEGSLTQLFRRSERVLRPPERLFLISDEGLDVLLMEETDQLHIAKRYWILILRNGKMP